MSDRQRITVASVALQAALYELLCDQFSRELINEVLVEHDHDNDGDPVLRITVVVEDDKMSQLDRHKLVGLVRQIRSMLESEPVDEFPIVSFVSKNDLGKMLEAH
jgi:hypothetical protein